MTEDITPPMDPTEEPGRDTKPDWLLDDASRGRSALALEEIDAVQANSPTCAACGQRVRILDKFGLCSKTSEVHAEWRRGARADEKTGARR